MTETPVMIRTSERSTFMRCIQRWVWSYEQKMKPNYTQPYFRFGDLIHQALAAYYIPSKVMTPGKARRGPAPADTFVKLYKAQLETLDEFNIKTEPDEWTDALELGFEMLTNYVKRYGKDPRYRIVAPELPFQIDIHDPETGLYLCTYVGTFDAVIQDLETMLYGLFEHKTAASISTGHLSMDEQAGSYWTFAPDWLRHKKILKPGEDLDFILYNFLRKGTEDLRPENELGQKLNNPSKEVLKNTCEDLGIPVNRSDKVEDLMESLRQQGINPESLGEVSKNQPPPLFHREMVYRGIPERTALYDRVVAQAKEMAMYRDGRLTVYKRPMGGCVGMFSCEFRDMCELHETGSDWTVIRDSMFHIWEPYASHEPKGEVD